VREGCDPSATLDPIWFDDPDTGRFVPMDAALFARLGSSAMRL